MLVIENAGVQIPVIRITNPFNPREFVHEEMTWVPSKTLAEYFPFPSVEVVVSINGKIIPTEQYPLTYLDRTDNLVICPVPTGDDDGKSIFRIVAMVALSVFAPGIGTALGGMIGVSSTLGIAMLTVGVTLAGSMLINAMLPASKKSDEGNNTESSYGIDGAKNTSIEGICVPVCYGTFRMGGNILAVHVDNTSEDTQVLYMLICAGEGRIGGISDVQINDTEIGNFKDVEVQTRLGFGDQDVIPWFNDTVTPINKSQKMTTDWYYSTTSVVDKFRLDFVAPQGLANISTKNGKSGELAVELEIQYRKVGATVWNSMSADAEIDSWMEVTGEYVPPAGTYDAIYDPVTNTGTYSMSPGGATVIDSNPAFIWKDINGEVITDPAQLEYLRTADAISVPGQVDTGGDGGSGGGDGGNGGAGTAGNAGSDGSASDGSGDGGPGGVGGW